MQRTRFGFAVFRRVLAAFSLYLYLPIYLSTYLPIYLSTYLPIYLPHVGRTRFGNRRV